MFFAFTLLFLTAAPQGRCTPRSCAAASMTLQPPGRAGRRRMIDLGPHAVFIIWAYVGVALGDRRADRLDVVCDVAPRRRRGSRRSRRRASAAARPDRRVDPHRCCSPCRWWRWSALVAVFAAQPRPRPRPRPLGADRQAGARHSPWPRSPDLGVPGFDTAALKGEVTVVNVFASWCIPCRDEHPLLMALKAADRRAPLRHQPERRARKRRGVPRRTRQSLRRRSAPTATAASRSTGASMACRRPSSSMPTGVITFKHVGPLTPKPLEARAAAGDRARHDRRPEPQDGSRTLGERGRWRSCTRVRRPSRTT